MQYTRSRRLPRRYCRDIGRPCAKYTSTPSPEPSRRAPLLLRAPKELRGSVSRHRFPCVFFFCTWGVCMHFIYHCGSLFFSDLSLLLRFSLKVFSLPCALLCPVAVLVGERADYYTTRPSDRSDGFTTDARHLQADFLPIVRTLSAESDFFIFYLFLFPVQRFFFEFYFIIYKSIDVRCSFI